MIEEKYVELIHAELDGELPEQCRAELSRYLLANPEARAFREELRQVCAALDAVEQVPPPPGLRESIRDALAAVQPPRRVGHTHVLRAPAKWRYAAAIAGGLIVSAVAFQLGFESREGLRVSDLVGTMAGQAPAAATIPVDSLRIDRDDLSGSVELYEAGPTLLLEFDIASQQPIEVVANFDGRETRFSGNSAGEGKGGRHFAIALEREAGQSSSVGLRFYAAGTLIHEEVLAATAAAR